MNKELSERIRKIREMERCFEILSQTSPERHGDDPALKDLLEQLEGYYANGEWLRDYALDEQGLLPEGLKRGVLSQDGVYDLLSAWKEAACEEAVSEG